MQAASHPQSDSSSWKFTSSSEEETRRLGALLAEAVEPGMVIALVGELGAGKTRLVQALAEALGVDRRLVNSPTFVLIQEYDGRLPIYHFDTYRLHDTDEFLELGADELMASDGLCVIEWADRVADVLPRDLLRIEIEVAGTNSRVFRLRATGAISIRAIEKLKRAR